MVWKTTPSKGTPPAVAGPDPADFRSALLLRYHASMHWVAWLSRYQQVHSHRAARGTRVRAIPCRAAADSLLVVCSFSAACTPEQSRTAEPQAPSAETSAVNSTASLERALVFTRTEGYRHASIEDGLAALNALAQEQGFVVEHTEDAADFSDETLARFDVVVWLNTTGDVLDDAAQAALERYIRSGGGWVGVHAAADAEYDWPWYGELLGAGAYFASHPEIQDAALVVERGDHASTVHLPRSWSVRDEWYNFQTNPRGAVSVLMTVDESSYEPGPGAMGTDHPIAWYHELEGGRSWYTALGHRPELYRDERFLQHLLGGIRWAAERD